MKKSLNSLKCPASFVFNNMSKSNNDGYIQDGLEKITPLAEGLTKPLWTKVP